MERRARAVVAALAMGTIGLSAALAPALGTAAGGETPVTVKVGNAPAEFNFGISPTLLPASDPGATELRLSLEAEPLSSGAGIPPGIQEATIGLDRSIRLEPGNLPVCRRSGVNAPQDWSARECPRAIVGHAEATIGLALPENPPLKIPTRGKVYYGGISRGDPELLVELPVSQPIEGVVWLIARVRPGQDGRIGSEMTFTVPTLVGGSGAVLELRLDLQRAYTEDGKRTGFVTAECRDGKLTATLAATFTDGTTSSQESIRACTSAKR